MRILHVKNVANYAWRLAQGQKRLGHDAVVWSRGDSYGFLFDALMPSGPKWNLWMARRWAQLCEFDVIHIHGGIWPTELAYLPLKLMKNRVFVHYHGSESRQGWGMSWQSIANGKFLATPDLKQYHPNGLWIPQPIDLPEKPAEMFKHDVPVFVHFSLPLKGTAQVIEMFGKAFGPIRHTRLDFPQGGHKDFYISSQAELWVLIDIPHDAVESVMKRADVVFDQIAPYGIYGYVSIEAMALGRPALATLDRDLYPADCPVIYPRATKLMELARSESARRGYGELGRAYVERVHESTVVAQKVLDAYERGVA